jgi:hypothetical protein
MDKWRVSGLLALGIWASCGGATSPAGDQGSGERTGGAGAGAGVIGATNVSTTWTFPALVVNQGKTAFPTYLAHLLGRTIDDPFPTDLACARVANGGSQPATIHLELSFAGYASSKSVDVTVAAGTSERKCLTPTFDIDALYQLTAPATGMIEGRATDDAGADVGSQNQVIDVPPVSDVAWADQGMSPTEMRNLAAVYVEPNAPVVDQLQRLAQASSVFSNFGNGNPYARAPYARTANLDPGGSAGELIYVESGESLEWAIGPVTCSGCLDTTVDVYLLTPSQLDGLTKGTSIAATAVWNAQSQGADVTVSPSAGFYYLVLVNADAAAGRAATWSRSVTREDVVRDLLLSLFSALRSLKITYTNVTGTYFDGWQHVRRVADSIAALSANCIDGSFVFASAAELLGLEPVLITKSGHAYVGIRSAPGSSTIWPIETTLVGNATATPFDAYVTAIANRAGDIKTDPQYQEIDVATMRERGVTPLVQP